MPRGVEHTGVEVRSVWKVEYSQKDTPWDAYAGFQKVVDMVCAPHWIIIRDPRSFRREDSAVLDRFGCKAYFQGTYHLQRLFKTSFRQGQGEVGTKSPFYVAISAWQSSTARYEEQ